MKLPPVDAMREQLLRDGMDPTALLLHQQLDCEPNSELDLITVRRDGKGLHWLYSHTLDDNGSFRFRVHSYDAVRREAIVTLEGHSNSAAGLQQAMLALIDRCQPMFIFDMSRLLSMSDLSGPDVFHHLVVEQAYEAGGGAAILNCNPQLKLIYDMFGYSSSVPMVKTIDEARAAIVEFRHSGKWRKS